MCISPSHVTFYSASEPPSPAQVYLQNQVSLWFKSHKQLSRLFLITNKPHSPEAQRFPERTHCTTEPEIGHENTLESLVICAQLHPSLCLLVQHRCSRHGQGHREHQQASLRVPQYNVTITHKPLHPSPPSSKTISPQLPARGTPQAGSPRSHNRKPLLTSWSSYCS